MKWEFEVQAQLLAEALLRDCNWSFVYDQLEGQYTEEELDTIHDLITTRCKVKIV